MARVLVCQQCPNSADLTNFRINRSDEEAVLESNNTNVYRASHGLRQTPMNTPQDSLVMSRSTA